MSTIHDRVASARVRLRDAGITLDEADIDARLLAEHALGWDAARYLTHANEQEPHDFAPRFEALVARRAAREPIAYVLGRREFWGLDFEVTPAVLVPRPETEGIIEAALAAFPKTYDAIDVADIGTGSGCLAVTLARERPAARVVATDVSKEALAVARANARRHGVAARIQFAETDLLNGIDRAFDLIVSNPPYVPERDRPTLAPEVRDHEPARALFAGDDGLEIVRRIADLAARRLKPEGRLIFEFGFGQADAVRAILMSTPSLVLLDLPRDLQGIPRVAVACPS
jgi:release factor glutamine methyltransferase